MKRRKHSALFTSKGRGANTIFGLILSVSMLIAISVIASFILIRMQNPIGSVSKAALAVLLISGALCGFVTSKRGRENGFSSALLSSVIFTAIILIVALIAKQGNIGGKTFMNAICYIGISAIFALIGKRNSGKARRRRHR